MVYETGQHELGQGISRLEKHYRYTPEQGSQVKRCRIQSHVNAVIIALERRRIVEVCVELVKCVRLWLLEHAANERVRAGEFDAEVYQFVEVLAVGWAIFRCLFELERQGCWGIRAHFVGGCRIDGRMERAVLYNG